MPKRKARDDPDSSDEDVAHREQVVNGKGAISAKKKAQSKAGSEYSAGPFDHHTRPTEAETRVSWMNLTADV